MACGLLSVQQIGANTNESSSSSCPLKGNNNNNNNKLRQNRIITTTPHCTKRETDMMAQNQQQRSKNGQNFSDDLPEGQVKGQPLDLTPGCPPKKQPFLNLNPQMSVLDQQKTPKKSENKSTQTANNRNINANKSVTLSPSSSSSSCKNKITHSSSLSSSSSSSSCKNSNCKNSSLAKKVTKVVVSSSSDPEEHEAFLAEIDSNLPNLLTRTFMGQDARFSFFLFFAVFSFSLVLGLFVIQASYAWHNYQLLEMLGREDFSEEFFYLHYHDPPETLTHETPIPGLRVNTSLYVH